MLFKVYLLETDYTVKAPRPHGSSLTDTIFINMQRLLVAALLICLFADMIVAIIVNRELIRLADMLIGIEGALTSAYYLYQKLTKNQKKIKNTTINKL